MQDAYVATFRLQVADQRHHATESTGRAVFDSPDPVGVIQVKKGEAFGPRPLFRRCRACNNKKHAYGDERHNSFHGFALLFEVRGILPQMPPRLRLRILRAGTIRA